MRREAENHAEKFIKKRLLKKRFAAMLLVLSLIVGSVTMYMLKHSAVAVSDEGAEEVGMVMEGENGSAGGEEVIVRELEGEDTSDEDNSDEESSDEEKSDEDNSDDENSDGDTSDEDKADEHSENDEQSNEEETENSDVSFEAGAEKQLSNSSETEESAVSDNSAGAGTETGSGETAGDTDETGNETDDKKEAVSDNSTVSDDNADKDAVSDNDTQKSAVSDNSTSDNSVSDDSVSKDSVSKDSVSKNTVSADSVSGDSVSKNAVKTEYVYEDSKVRVVATLERADAIPDDAEFKVTEVTKGAIGYNYDAYMEALNESASDNKVSDNSAEYNEKNTLLYDIAFMVAKQDEEGNVIEGEKREYQPEEGSVTIRIEFLDKQLSKITEESSSEAVEIKHLPLEDNVKNAVDTTADAKDIESSDIKVEEVSANSVVDEKPDTAEFTVDSFSVFAFSTTQASEKNKYFVFDNYTKDGYKDKYYLDSSRPYFGADKYYKNYLALGVAGNFHVVAFNNFLQYNDICGNVLVKNFYSEKDFGTRNAKYELSYIQNLCVGKEGDLTKAFEDNVIALGSSNRIDDRADNGASIRINGRKVSKPQLFIRDKDSSKAPFVDIAAVKQEMQDMSDKMAKTGDGGVKYEETTDKYGQCKKVTYLGNGGAGYLSFDWKKWNEFVAGKRLVFNFPKDHAMQSIIINIDCSGAEYISFPNKASEIYVNGKALPVGETTEVETGRVVYNFYNASGKDIYLQEVFGQVIAMGADLTVNKGDGNFIAENVYIKGETHRRDFIGTTEKEPGKGNLRIHKMVVNDFGSDYVRDNTKTALLSNVKFRITNKATGNYIVFKGFTGRAGEKGVATEYDKTSHAETGNTYTVVYNQSAQWTVLGIPQGVYTVDEVADGKTLAYDVKSNTVSPIERDTDGRIYSRVTKYDLTVDVENPEIGTALGEGGDNVRRVFSRDLDNHWDVGPEEVRVGDESIANTSHTMTVQVCNYYSTPLVPISINKCFSGGEWGNKDVFTFEVEPVKAYNTRLSDGKTPVNIPTDKMPMPERTKITISKEDAERLSDGSYLAVKDFGYAFYAYEGNYVYKVKEIAGSDTTITYDENEYYIDVEIKKKYTNFQKTYTTDNITGFTKYNSAYYKDAYWSKDSYKYNSDHIIVSLTEDFWYLGADETYTDAKGNVLAKVELTLGNDPDTARIYANPYNYKYTSGKIITFYNKRSAKLTIKKEWLDSNGKKIEDTSTFSPIFIQLYRAAKMRTPELIGTYTLSPENNWQTTVEGLEESYTLAGKHTYTFTYSIKEVYEKEPGEWITVEDNVSYKYVGGTKDYIKVSAGSKSAATVICTNRRSDYVLPATGGIGTTPVRNIGMGVMIIAIMGAFGIFFGNKKYLN